MEDGGEKEAAVVLHPHSSPSGLGFGFQFEKKKQVLHPSIILTLHETMQINPSVTF